MKKVAETILSETFYHHTRPECRHMSGDRKLDAAVTEPNHTFSLNSIRFDRANITEWRQALLRTQKLLLSTQ